MKAIEVVKLLNISKMTLHNWVKAGKVKVKARHSKRTFEYDDESIYALLGRVPERPRLEIKYTEDGTESSFICVNDLKIKEILKILTK